MDIFKRYLISFSIVSVILFIITFYAERFYEGQMPHNLASEDQDELLVTLPPGKAYEKCINLQKTKHLHYAFEARAPLEFNMHYHLEGNTFYPVPSGMYQEMESSFTPEQDAGYYCLMWANPAEKPVWLNLRYKVINL